MSRNRLRWLLSSITIGLFAMLVLLDAVGIAAVYLAALVVGAAETIADNAANILIPSVVDRQRLTGANSTLQSIETVCQAFLGNPIGGLAFAVFAALPFLVTSGAFAIASVMLVALAGVATVPRHETGRLADGVRWLWGNALMLRLVTLAALLGLAIELSRAQLVLYALHDLRLSEAAFGVFALAAGVGGLVGAAITPRLTTRIPRRGVLIGAMLAAGTAIATMGLMRDPVVAAMLLLAFGAAGVAINVIIATLRHLIVPDELLGRVLGAWRTAVWGAFPVGALLGGVLTKALGSPSQTFVVSGAAVAVIGIAAIVVLRRFDLDVHAGGSRSG